MNTKMIQPSNAVCAFRTRSLAPTTFGFKGSALPMGGAAFEPVGHVSISTWTDRRTYSTRTLMI
jgi:hypothetical protein